MGGTTAIASGGNPQDRNGAFSVGELNSPRVAPLPSQDRAASLFNCLLTITVRAIGSRY
ncbi:hypothetical protein BJP36_38165 [Moorena producens JHB]|uniref:Uncharacterized protein n=1 Tax=Moorena producens (strain JHB) TaxID=1454205 RepID=A0A9Q9UWI0_MOOP1|nr:hypothetical protein [Moorena producens]WAN69920.1 hypothetical protein BJP36_38165 [Moorena producens JHB]